MSRVYESPFTEWNAETNSWELMTPQTVWDNGTQMWYMYYQRARQYVGYGNNRQIKEPGTPSRWQRRQKRRK